MAVAARRMGRRLSRHAARTCLRHGLRLRDRSRIGRDLLPAARPVIHHARLFSDRIPWQKFFITNTLALAIGSTAIFVIGKAFFCRPAATLETDFALLPKFLFGGALLSLPVCFLTYSVKDIIEGLLFQSIDDTVAPSEE